MFTDSELKALLEKQPRVARFDGEILYSEDGNGAAHFIFEDIWTILEVEC